MGTRRSVALISDDLMFASQLQAAMRQAGGTCALVVGDGIPDEPTVFVDLNTRVEERIGMIRSLRDERPDLEIVGFCHHEARGIRRAALAAGATRIINNGALQIVALRLSGGDPRQA